MSVADYDPRASWSVEPLSALNFEGWARLMASASTGCFCRYWHFSGDKNTWLARMAFDAEANREEQRAALAAGDGTALGLVARDGDEVVGWLKMARRDRLTKLVQLGPYRRVDSAPTVYAVACLYVAESSRRRGIARALVRAVPAFVASLGGTAVECFPRVPSTELPDAQLMLGTLAHFEELGFERVGGEDTFPVLRLILPPNLDP